MEYNSTKDYLELVDTLTGEYNIPDNIVSQLMGYVMSIYRSDLENRYSKPMLWIGMYIALASLCCILLMVADLLHGLRSRKLWFPCKYFSVNAFSLSVISVAMKLPVDLSGSMPGDVDQAAKLGSMAFMCTMMANFLPCLATMDSNELLTNITALGILVVTLVVNVCIQINTGVVSYKENAQFLKDITHEYDLGLLGINKNRNTIIAIIYVIMLLVLLIIHVCSSLAILKTKQIIQQKYQKAHETASNQDSTGKLTVDKLRRHVSNYWIMAGSGSPQFIIVCSATTTAAGVICALTTILHTLTMSWTISAMLSNDYDSAYKWSTLVILIVQFIGVVLGTVAPLSRCFASLSFKVSIKSISNHMKVFKVEGYWTEKLHDWKDGSTRFPFRSHKLKAVFISSSGKKNAQSLEESRYVLQLEDETELADRTLEGLSKYLDLLIERGEKQHPENLMNLIEKYCTMGFQGVKKFDNNDHHVHYQDSWSMPLVTLTTIAVTLPNIEKVEVKRLLKSVREGLKYVKFVEKNPNATDDYVSIQKAAETLWEEVDVCHKWLGIKLKDINSRVNAADCEEDATMQIVQLFLKEAEKKINEGGGNSKLPSICANSMSRITKTIIADKESQKKLFDELSSWIAGIMAACLTNLPQAIAMKCHTSVIEKRVAFVQVAAQLLGETKQIINTLNDRDVPSMNPEDLPFINKWRAYFSDP
ncbi:hypothetical protein L1987_14226 [Smallanthus sonchifolius]|uniref:Uncharacterized protein n=1 Tax=Smallanthus sonchifolius TaxID=185202 RepID=A0ACB9J4C4_9ASTR|nr:hypothetical protein L1987_14226 [Smallanthus sonchifolius]